MAELGGTRDAAELVPGNPAGLRTTVTALDRYGGILERVAHGFYGIDDGGWGGSWSDAFHEHFDHEPERWSTCSDSFHAARDALARYADTLQWAQRRAEHAIALWDEGERATEAARVGHEEAQQRAEEDAAAAGLPSPTPVEFVDPGESVRVEAVTTLEYARDQLRVAGDEAATVVDGAQQLAPQQPGRLTQLLDNARELLGGAVRSLGELFGGGVRLLGETADGVLDRVGDVLNTAYSNHGDLLGRGLEFAGERTGFDRLTAAGGAVRDAYDEFGNRIDRRTDSVGDIVAELADTAGGRIEEAYDQVATYIEGEDGGDDNDWDDGDLGGDDPGDGGGDPDEGDGEPGGEPDDGDDGSGSEDGEEAGDDSGSQDQEAEEPEVDRNGHWADANGDTPDPAEISAQDRRAHILYGDGDDIGGGHRHDSGVPNKHTFPPDWEDDKIIDEVEDVARNPDEPPVYDERRGTWKASGTRDGVDIEVIVTPEGQVKTGYPTGGEGVHRNDEHGDPQPLE